RPGHAHRHRHGRPHPGADGRGSAVAGGDGILPAGPGAPRRDGGQASVAHLRVRHDRPVRPDRQLPRAAVQHQPAGVRSRPFGTPAGVAGGSTCDAGNPVPSLLACSLITAGFVIASVWYKDAILVAILVAGLAALLLYILTMACLMRLRQREPELFHAYRAPLGWLSPVAVVLLSGFAIFVYPRIEHGDTVLILGAALYALGFGVFAFRRTRGAFAEGAPIAEPNHADVSPQSASPSPWLDRLA